MSVSAVGFIIQEVSDSIPGWHQGGPVNLGILGKLRYALSKAIDVFESLGSVEGQGSRTGVNNRAIFIMKRQHIFIVIAADSAGLGWDVQDCPWLWAGELCQRGYKQAIYDGVEYPDSLEDQYGPFLFMLDMDSPQHHQLQWARI